MNNKQVGLASLTFLVFFFFICAASAADTKAIEQALRDLDAQWSAAAAAKDLEKTISFYSENALVLPTNAPAATTKDAIRNTRKDMIERPGVDISWHTTRHTM